jgi:site-specific recombinase XerD
LGLEGPSNHSTAREVGVTPLPLNRGDAINDATLPPVLAGLDKAEALAYVSRLFDAAQAGAVLWGDKLLLKRFLEQCSRTGSKETQDGYRRELRHFTRWRDQNHPHLHLRELDPALVDDWVSHLREQVADRTLMPRSFNRRIAAVSALYRWASEPTRSAVTGVPRNPMPRRATMHAPNLAKPLTQDELGVVLATIAQAKGSSPIARRDWVMVKGSYLIGCRVSELCALRWQDIERLDDGGQIHLLGKGSKTRTVRVSAASMDLFESLGRGEPEDWLFPSNRRNGPLTRQGVAARMARWGQAAGVRLHPHRCRHTHATHAIRRGCDVFVLSATLGHSSTSTTAAYVAANPGDSSSLRLS